MMAKVKERERAIKLRKQGKTYGEILDVVPVSKSTLSLWLRDVGLAKVQKQRLTAKKRAAQVKGGARKRELRIAEEKEMRVLGLKDILHISDHELFLIGVSLYWAEGTKSSGKSPSTMVDFGNSDPAMLRLFIVWLLKFGDVKKDDIRLRLHVHDNHRKFETALQKQWAKLLNVSINQFDKSNFKKHNPKTKRYKTGSDYIGLVSVRVPKSTHLNRRIMGWIYAIIATQK